MSYIVLARRWRPQKFADLVGQEVVARTLQNAVASGQVAHAYLLTGIRGVGKTTIARLMAMAVNCEKGPAKEPCGECGACTSVMNGSNLDVQEMDAASHTGVDDIRDILDAVRYPPACLAYKVYIIDEAHMLSKNAFNALLKTLEEPPPQVIFILATTEAEKLPITVRSRCQRFDLRRMGVDEVTGYLREILGQERVAYEDEALHIIARAADGSMRDALSLAERVLAFSGKRLGTKDTRETLGLVRPELLRAFSDAVFNGDARVAVEQLRQAVQFGQSSRGLLLAVGEMWHQLTCCVVDQSLLDSEPDAAQLDWLRAWAGRWDVQVLDLRYQVLIAGLRDMAWMDEGRGAEMLAMRLASLHRLQPPAHGEVLPEVKKQLPNMDQTADSQRVASEIEKGESRALAAEPVAQYVAEEAAPAVPVESEADDELPFDGAAPGFQYGDWAEAVHAYGQIRPNIAAQFEHAVCLEFGHKVRVAGAALHEETIPVAERLAFAEWLGREVHWESGASQAGESLSQARQREAEQLRQHMRETAEANPHVKLLREELDAELVNVYASGVERNGS